MVNIHTYTIGAYTPEFDVKQLKDVSVIGGRNFMPSLEGYKTDFGSSLLSDRRLTRELLLGSEVFSLGESLLLLCTNFGILAYDDSTEGWYYLVRSPTELSSRNPWSLAYVGGDYYFCKLGFGVWRYRPNDNSSEFLEANVPSGACSVCSAGGRLVILGSSTYAWSAIGDGADLTTSLETGAGFQSLNLAGGGKPLAVKEFINGFLVYTSSGIIKAESIESTNPFYHKLLTGADLAPVSANAITSIGNGSHVYLGRTGFWVTSGGYPEPFQASFGEFIVSNLLKFLINSSQEIPIALRFSEFNRWLIVSYAEYSITPSPYSCAFVYDIELERWGRYDENHYFLGGAYVTSGTLKGYRLIGAISDNCIHIYDKDYGVSVPAEQQYKNNYEVPKVPNYVTVADGVSLTTFTASAQMETYNFTALPTELGYYVYDLVNSTAVPDLTYPKLPEMTTSRVVVVNLMNLSDWLSSLLERFLYPASGALPRRYDLLGGNTPVVAFKCCATMGTSLGIYSEIKRIPDLLPVDSQLDVGVYHIAEFNDIGKATVLTGFCQIQEETVGEDTEIDMETVPDVELDMETVPDSEIDMGFGFLSRPQFTTSLNSSSDGYGNLAYHNYELEPNAIAGNRFNFNCYSTGLYHRISLGLTESGSYYHLKQLQINFIEGGLIYDRT